ncbi:MAG: hypothetical protein MZW92_76030 [Comamonadaceae bacterium]|nr:hypothetical protein [Comamonadaceae bacterium]
MLFAGSIGRTDFPGGDYDTLIASITQQAVADGRRHRASSRATARRARFGRERRSNPYVGGT